MPLSIKTDWALGANIGLQLDGYARDFSIGDTQMFGLHGWYQVSPTIRLGLFAQQTRIGVNSTSGSIRLARFYGVEALLEPVEMASIQIYAGSGNTDLGGWSPDVSITGYGMSARYDFTPNLTGRIGYDSATQIVPGQRLSDDELQSWR